MALATGMAHVHTVPGEILVGPENAHEPLAPEIRVPADRISAIVVGKRQPVTGETALRLSPLPWPAAGILDEPAGHLETAQDAWAEKVAKAAASGCSTVQSLDAFGFLRFLAAVTGEGLALKALGRLVDQ